MNDPQASEAVEALWERFRPLVRSRIEVLERFAAGDGGVKVEDAARAAHNLAGALGSYGRHEGSETARRIERALRSDDTIRRDQLQEEVSRLKAQTA
jgi:HPt (histidine-containing phosphotransfer) domain-containing protein